ncbi:MAG: GTPase ObgE [bacterium]|nr:GTPase ObgE [bacterium]
MFVDWVKIKVIAGRGGDGCVSFRREKYVPKGGPNGGKGGHGGNVVLVSDEDVDSLVSLKFQPILRAGDGEGGQGKLKTGHDGKDVVVAVPPGSVVRDPKSGVVLFDFTASGQRFVAARGGRGGRGNASFKSATNQAPRRFELGKPGESATAELELKLIADVGLTGFPNAGKSSLLSKICDARPKIASYPFTTLSPNLGVLKLKGDYRTIKVADVPGLINGAHENRGLGHQFLRHIERTSVLVLVIDIAAVDGHDPLEDYQVLRRELALHDEALASRPFLVACNKMDLEAAAANLDAFRERSGVPPEKIFPISCLTGYGLDELVEGVKNLVNRKE